MVGKADMNRSGGRTLPETVLIDQWLADDEAQARQSKPFSANRASQALTL